MNNLLNKYIEISTFLKDEGINPILYGSLGVSLYLGEFKEIGDIDILIEDEWIKGGKWPELIKLMNKHGFKLINEHEHEFINDQNVDVSFSLHGILIKDKIGDPIKDSVIIQKDNIDIKTLSIQYFIKAYEYSAKDGYRLAKRGKNDLQVVELLKAKLLMKDDFNKQQYSKYYEQYLESNADGRIGGGTIQERVQLFLRYVPKGRTVFEIGSGSGEDAIALQKAGFEVIASDYVDEFVKILKEKSLNAISFDAKLEEIPNNTDAIYANAVFVHFSPSELTGFLNKAKTKLSNEKVIFFSVLKGQGLERSARGRGFERDFCYYTLDSLQDILEKTGYSTLDFSDDEKWIQIIAKSA